MKRLFVFLALAAALLTVASCYRQSVLSVDAQAILNYPDGRQLSIPTQHYDGFYRKSLTDDNLENIFVDLTRHADPSFTTATLILDVRDAVSGAPLRNETYGVVFNSQSGHYDFAPIGSY